MAAVEKNDVISFTLLEPLGPYKRAIIEVDLGETVASATGDTITLDEPEYRVDTIKSVKGHVFATGAPVEYSYATNVLTKEDGGDTRDVIEILFTS
jgi:hypothetical protein